LIIHHFQTSELAIKSRYENFMSYTFPLSEKIEQNREKNQSSLFLKQSANGSRKLSTRTRTSAKCKSSPSLFLSSQMMAKLVIVIKVSSNLSHLKPTAGKGLKAILVT